ncbi:3D (Asp-Asp-Asp) domain-containing protein [Ureibacillus xyleni]|uniref:3D (Asp-Asp-Asp) domain-containing protein n=1 Tax=Ureibacillus xyleni TaxID=614648 RepID=A0A285T1V3_9BACL|nr:3D domain-containing protein [Ureibacillus xyleni]SOC15259.1 3D (Asp-Asp-Asp) domain-containing protein [Ureibacillus xyleni]
MFKKMISMVPVAVLSITLGTTAQAATITVEKGDTLWDLSRANHTTVENIQKFNHLTTDLIHPGDVLTIVSEKHYTVKNGDTLWDIARDHQVNVSQIKEWNQLHKDLIQPGLKLVIFEGLKTNSTTLTENPVKPVASKSKERTPNVTVPSTSKAGIEPTTPVINNVETKAPAPATNKADTEVKADSKEITVEATAYTASCDGCSGITSTGINLKDNPDAKVISVDPTVIPLGSKVYVEGYGEAIAGDTGGSIKGKRIDVFVPTKQEAINFGVKQVEVKILD